jgi:HK97 family phage major capsid protein
MNSPNDLQQQLEQRKLDLTKQAEDICQRATDDGRTDLTLFEGKQVDRICDELRGINDHLAQIAEDEARGGIPENLKGIATTRSGWGDREVRADSAARLAPLGYSDEQLRRAWDQLHRGESAVLETRAPATGGGLLPPEIGPILPVFPRHDNRLLTRLPGIELEDLPAIQYIQVTSVTGTAAIVAEGAAKPEITIPAVPKVATARKIAAHTGISWELYSGDYPAFVSSVQVELLKSVVDQENLQLFGGTGEANGQVNGLTTDPNVLTFDASTVTTTPGPWDAIEHGIELLRSGPAKATPDLALAHPSTWSAIRRQTNTYGDYYVASDPSEGQVNQAWGVDVLVSTQFTAGTFTLVDTSLYGRVVVRESLVTRIGYAGTDFTDNIVRHVAEERLTQTIERPEAICVISKLPIALAASHGKK